MDSLEALANAAIGFLVSWAVTLFVLGFDPLQSVGITALFFALSFTRAYLLRRLFRSIGQ